MSEFTDSIERELRGCEAFSVGSCPGCSECGLGEDPSDTDRELAEESRFSWRACDSCGSTFGGDRHPAHYLDDERAIVHVHVCTDCLFFHANGDEPDDWSKHP
jgi:hypothetical protein